MSARRRTAPRTAPRSVQSQVQSMTATEFARALGITLNGVKKAITSGRIPPDCVARREHGSRQPYVITKPDEAARQWQQNSRVKGRRGDRPVNYDELPEDVRRARAARDAIQARFYAVRAKRLEATMRREVQSSRDTVPISKVVAALAQGVAEVRERVRDRVVRAHLDRMKRRVIELVKESDRAD